VPGLPLGSWIQGQVGMSLFCPQRLLPEAPQLIKGPVDVAARVRSRRLARQALAHETPGTTQASTPPGAL